MNLTHPKIADAHLVADQEAIILDGDLKPLRMFKVNPQWAGCIILTLDNQEYVCPGTVNTPRGPMALFVPIELTTPMRQTNNECFARVHGMEIARMPATRIEMES